MENERSEPGRLKSGGVKMILLVKDNELADYPADILVDGEIRKSYNLEFECINLGAKILIGKSLPSDLIKKLRDNGIIFMKINSLEELDGLDMEMEFPKEFKNRRGCKCGKKGF